MNLTYALMRVDQIAAHLAATHPETATDAHLAGLLETLRADLTDQQIIADDCPRHGE